MDPRISVVIPVYNPGPWLRLCLDSVLQQSLIDFEVLVVDDGSDEDLGWVESLDPRIRVSHHLNKGVSVARNIGAASARAPWLAFLDQDDTWAPEKLERQWASLTESPSASFHYTGFTWVTDAGRTPATPVDITYHDLLADHHICWSSVVVAADKYAAAGGHDPLLAQMQDWDLMLRLAALFGTPARVDGNLVDYHVHADNASHDYTRAATERKSVLLRHSARARAVGDERARTAVRSGLKRTDELFAEKAISAARQAAHDGRWPEVARHAARAAAWSPSAVALAAAATANAKAQRWRGRVPR